MAFPERHVVLPLAGIVDAEIVIVIEIMARNRLPHHTRSDGQQQNNSDDGAFHGEQCTPNRAGYTRRHLIGAAAVKLHSFGIMFMAGILQYLLGG